jgi:pilus assembly protein Flp/PilA
MRFLKSDLVCRMSSVTLSLDEMIRSFLADESAVTAIEYGLIAAGISVAIIATVNGLGTKISSNFNKFSTSLR